MKSVCTVVSNKLGVETDVRKSSKKPCRNCGSTTHGSALEYRRNNCPAFNAKCGRLSRVGHFKGQCFSNSGVNGVETVLSVEQKEECSLV